MMPLQVTLKIEVLKGGFIIHLVGDNNIRSPLMWQSKKLRITKLRIAKGEWQLKPLISISGLCRTMLLAGQFAE